MRRHTLDLRQAVVVLLTHLDNNGPEEQTRLLRWLHNRGQTDDDAETLREALVRALGQRAPAIKWVELRPTKRDQMWEAWLELHEQHWELVRHASLVAMDSEPYP